jgi:oxazoline/thiazoline dehydrogenase
MAMYRLSPSTVIRPVADGLIAESLLTGGSLALGNASRRTLFFAFTETTALSALLAAVGPEKTAAVERFIEHCHALQLLVEVREDGTLDEPAQSKCWEPHDGYFHLRSRRGWHGHPVGATFHLANIVAETPAVKAEASAQRISLDRPAPDREDDEPTLTEALERRRSVYSVEPVDLHTLGRFLYRTCRVTATEPAGQTDMFLKKLYPSGGSLHSLEVYVVAHRCPGLPRGVYHYGPVSHELIPVSALDGDAEMLLQDARQAAGGKLPQLPSVLFVVSTRFGRISRKYQSLAYSLVLKEVGALFQTWYLVATAMRLAPCAIGSGDSERFSRVTRTHPLEETSVGEFTLGGSR